MTTINTANLATNIYSPSTNKTQANKTLQGNDSSNIKTDADQDGNQPDAEVTISAEAAQQAKQVQNRSNEQNNSDIDASEAQQLSQSTQNQISSQGDKAILAQANVSAQNVMALLR